MSCISPPVQFAQTISYSLGIVRLKLKLWNANKPNMLLSCRPCTWALHWTSGTPWWLCLLHRGSLSLSPSSFVLGWHTFQLLCIHSLYQLLHRITSDVRKPNVWNKRPVRPSKNGKHKSSYLWNLGKAEPEVQTEYPFHSSLFSCESWKFVSCSPDQGGQTQPSDPIVRVEVVLDLACQA